MKALNDIAIFVRVVQCESFSAAGRDLHMSPSAVSKTVTRLETALGVKLLNRTTHHMFLTDAGSEFYQRCRRGLAEIEDAQHAALGHAETLTGVLRVHSTLDIGQSLISPLLARFMVLYPTISVELDMGTKAVNLMERRYDVALRSKDIGDRHRGYTNITSRVLADVQYAVVASPCYLLRAGRPARPDDLTHHACLIHWTQNGADDWRFRLPEGEVAVPVSGHFRSNNWHAIREAARAGVGIARLPDFTVAGDLAAGRLVALFGDEVHSDRTLRAFYPRAARGSVKLQTLLEYLEAGLKQPADGISARVMPPKAHTPHADAGGENGPRLSPPETCRPLATDAMVPRA